MEKLGVVTEPEKTKTASAGSRCPACGQVLDQETPNYCKNCGTKPFEPQPKK